MCNITHKLSDMRLAPMIIVISLAHCYVGHEIYLQNDYVITHIHFILLLNKNLSSIDKYNQVQHTSCLKLC